MPRWQMILCLLALIIPQNQWCGALLERPRIQSKVTPMSPVKKVNMPQSRPGVSLELKHKNTIKEAADSISRGSQGKRRDPENSNQDQESGRTSRNEVEQLSVIASSVMALGVLPGGELKSMLEGVCEAMPADSLKALLVAVGESLGAKQHKAILQYVAPSVAGSLWKGGNASARAMNESAKAFEEAILTADNETMLEEDKIIVVMEKKRNEIISNKSREISVVEKRNTSFDWDKFGRDATGTVISGLVPRRLAKVVINRYLRDAEPKALKIVVSGGLRRVDPEVLARLAPRCLAAVVGAPPPPLPTDIVPIEKKNHTQPPQRSWWSGFWKLRRAADDAETFLKERTVASSIDTVTAAWLAPRLVLALPVSERRVQLQAAIQSLSDRRARALLATPVITKKWIALTEERSTTASTDTFEMGGNDLSFDSFTTKSTNDKTSDQLKTEKQNPLFKAAGTIGRAMAGPSSLAVWCPPAEATAPLTPNITVPEAIKPILPPPVVEQRARSAVDDAVGRLPPALIAGQLRSLVESLPDEFVRDEAVALVLALPPGDLVEAATSLVDAAPEEALRSLAAKLLDLAADMRKAPQGATTLHSLARAAEVADVELIRSAARTLLEGVAPRRLCAEVVRLLEMDAAPLRVKRAVVNALVNAEQRSKQYENLREMFQKNRDPSTETQDKAKVLVPTEEPPSPKATQGSRDRVAAAMTSLRRVLLEKSRVGVLSDDDEANDEVYAAQPPASSRQRRRDLRSGRGRFLFSEAQSSSFFSRGAANGQSNGQMSSQSGTPLEALLISTAKRLDPELVVEKALETLAALPPETYESLAKLLVNALWERVVLSALPTDLSASVKALVVAALGEAPRDATLAASYVASATGGVAAGGAAKTALGASAKVVGSTKGALALSSSHFWATPSSWPFLFSGLFASFKAGAISVIFSAKGLALASVAAYAAKAFVAGTIEFEDNDWLRVVAEATVAALLLGLATVSVSYLDELQLSAGATSSGSKIQADNFFASASATAASLSGKQDLNIPDAQGNRLDDPRAALIAIFCGDDANSFSDYELRGLLLSLARQPPEREAAVACRDAIRDAVKRGALDFAISSATDGNEDAAAVYLAKLKARAQRRQPWGLARSKEISDPSSTGRRRPRRRKAV